MPHRRLFLPLLQKPNVAACEHFNLRLGLVGLGCLVGPVLLKVDFEAREEVVAAREGVEVVFFHGVAEGPGCGGEGGAEENLCFHQFICFVIGWV